MKPKCFSCKRPVDKRSDFCYGCENLVCISCVTEYGHEGLYGKHGKKERRETPRPATKFTKLQDITHTVIRKHKEGK